MTAASEGMVRILTLRARYFVSADHPDVPRLRDRLDEAGRRALPEALGPMFAGAAPDDDALWFVQRLALELDLDASAEVDDIGRHWARGLASALLAELTEEGGGNVVRFADRTDYLGRFLVDLAGAVAWGRWYYEGFSGLRLLPASAAIRTAVLDEPHIGLDALLRLTEKDAATVLSALGGRDAQRVLAAFAGEGPNSTEDEALAALADACESMEAANDGLADARADLALYIGTRRRCPTVGGTALARAAGAATSLLRLRARGAALHAVLDALRRSDVRALRGLAAAEAERLLPLTRASPELLARLVRTGDPPRAAPGGPGETRHGGVFLLLPLLADLPLEKATEGWPAAGVSAAPAVVRLLLLVKCLGGARAAVTLHDPLIRALAGVDGSLDETTLRGWRRGIAPAFRRRFTTTLHGRLRGIWCAGALAALARDRKVPRRDLGYLALPPAAGVTGAVERLLDAAAQALLRQLAWRLPGFAESHFDYLFRNVLDVHAAVAETPERRVVTLSRPPLDLVLRMTGMTRARLALPWLGGPAIELFPEG